MYGITLYVSDISARWLILLRRHVKAHPFPLVSSISIKDILHEGQQQGGKTCQQNVKAKNIAFYILFYIKGLDYCSKNGINSIMIYKFCKRGD